MKKNRRGLKTARVRDKRVAGLGLREIHACLSAVVDGSVDGVLIADQNKAILKANRAVQRMLGCSAAHVIGRRVDSLFPKRDKKRILWRMQHADSMSARPAAIRVSLKRVREHRGRLFPVEVFVSTVHQNNRKFHTLTVRDVSKQEKELETREKLASLIDHSNDAIFVRRLDGKISSWNAAAERIFGYSGDEIIGHSSAVLLPMEKADETQKVLQRVRRGERIEHFRTKRLRKDGKTIDVSLTISPIRNAKGRIAGASTIARDITEKMRLQAEILQISEREQSRVGRDLHDGLGQQLTGVALLCRRLAARLARSKAPEALDAATLVQHMDESIEQARALARGMSPVLESSEGLMIALEELASRTAKLFRSACVFECDSPVLMRDHSSAVHLYRIAQEAISNALRHGKAKRLKIELSRSSNQIKLSVEDDGGGIQLEAGRSVGLGLNIMKYRAGIIGGELSIGRRKSRGTRVVCVLSLPEIDIQ